MSIEFKNLKGTGDYMPLEQKVRQEVIQKLREVFEKYGYQPLETPIICYFDVLSSKYAGGAEILKEVYRLSDQGGRELGLRYDLTVPLAKVVGMNPEIRLPFKRYEIGKVFRDGPVKTGRNREFVQCDVDMVGVKSIMAEAEFMTMAVEVYKMLGLNVYISINNRKLLSGIIESVGIGQDLASDVILCLDKLGKTSYDGVKAELLLLGIEYSKIELLLDYMKMQPEKLFEELLTKQPNELLIQGAGELEELNGYIETTGIRNSIRFTPSLARGLEIYTGTVWEVFLKDGSISSSVGAGGRYDKIIGAFLGDGTQYPAVGMTFGLDVIYEALVLKGIAAGIAPVDYYIIPLDTEKACLKLVMELRNAGLKADLDMTGRKLKKSLDYANRQGIPYAVIIGENELATSKARLKEMNSGSEYEVDLDAVVKTVVQMAGS